MRNGCRLAAGVLACALLALTAPGASALVVHGRNHHFLGIQLHRGIRAASVPGSVAAQQQTTAHTHDNGTLSYHNGPVVHSSAPYLIFWIPSGQSMSSSSQKLMEEYFTDVATDSGESDDVFGVTRQYTDAAGFAGGGQTFSTATQAILDTQPYPAIDATNCPDTSTSYPTCITDTQLQQELIRLIAADGLPTDGPSSATEFPAHAPIYFIVLPGDVDVCDPGVGCADSTFCAYHSSMTDGSNTLLYAAVPMLLADSEPKSCQSDGNSAVQEPNGDPADVVISDISHEDNETISDPTAEGWWDNTSGNEEADGCSMTGPFNSANETDPNAFLPTLGGSAGSGTLYDQLINNDKYYTQSEWSNGDLNCEMHPSAGTITPAFSETPAAPYPVGSTITFDPSASTSTNTISSETWNFGDGSSPVFETGSPTSVSHTYTAAGTYTVTLTLVDNRGNLQSTTRQVTIEPGPTASFTFSPSSPLEGTAVSFDGSASTPDPGAQISSYAWNFGDNTTGTGAKPSHTYTTHGTYTVTLTVTDSDGLTDTTTQQITVVDEPPTASFTIAPNPAEAGQPVAFNGSGSSDPDGTISSYAWNFGDGSTGTGATPSHTYTTQGTYTVTLTVTDSDGASNTATQPITVEPGPTASFTYSPSSPQEGTAVSFDGTGSSDPDGTISSYAWNFGDGTTITGTNATPSHAYTTNGTYTVTLTVTDSNGASNTTTQQITVAEPPTASFTISAAPYAVGQAVSFNGSGSSDPDGSISSYAWNFGDNTTGTGATPSHTYKSSGTYTITLTVTDNDGLSNTTHQQIEVYSLPTAAFDFSPSSPLEGTAVSFDGSGSSDPDPGVTISSYAWNFGDNTTGTGAKPSHTYAHGTYTVTLTVTNSVGLSNTTTQQITVADEAPTASFTIAPNPAVAGQPVAFNGGASNDPDGTITSYAWNFGDGATGTGAALDHTYGAAGTYTITLTVTDSGGKTGSVTTQLHVSAAPPVSHVTPPASPASPPRAGFAVTTAHPAAQVPVQFSGASSSDPDGSITSYSWSFGDGTRGSGLAPSHTYRTAGVYRVSLTVLASTGTSASTSSSIVVVAGSRITKVSVSGKGRTRLLAITVNGPGTLLVGSRRFRILVARTIKVRITPTVAQRRRLAAAARLKIVIPLEFTPVIGARSARRIPITLLA